MNRTPLFSSIFSLDKTRRNSLLGATAALAATFVLVACGGKEDAKAKPAADASQSSSASAKAGQSGSAAPRPVLTVTTTKPQVSDWSMRLGANGNVIAWQEAIVGAEANGLRLNDVRVNVGDVVRKGQVLATFAPETSRADVALQQASVAEAEAALAEAQANAARARTLQDSGALSAQQINQFLTGEKTAAARVAAAKAQSQSSQLRLGFTRVVAPDDGVISARSATVGSVVGAGQELFKLIRQNRLEWRGEVTAAELPRVVPGQRVTINLPSGQTAQGKVRIVAPTIDPQSRTAIAFVDLDKGSAAKAGMFARGEFEVGTTKALHVPQTALVARDGFTYAMKIDANNKVTQLKVQAGRRNGDRVEIREGLKEGDVLVASGAAFLADGDTVRIVDSVGSPAAAPAPQSPAKTGASK
jgi:HlyD family secretion protein